MSLTLHDLIRKLRQTCDEVSILEVLEIDMDEILERFRDKVEAKFDELCEEFEEETEE